MFSAPPEPPRMWRYVTWTGKWLYVWWDHIQYDWFGNISFPLYYKVGLESKRPCAKLSVYCVCRLSCSPSISLPLFSPFDNCINMIIIRNWTVSFIHYVSASVIKKYSNRKGKGSVHAFVYEQKTNTESWPGIFTANLNVTFHKRLLSIYETVSLR